MVDAKMKLYGLDEKIELAKGTGVALPFERVCFNLGASWRDLGRSRC
jgi:hypothetical protein